MFHRLPLLAASLLAVATALLTSPVEAKVLADGKPAKGVYWQKIKKGDGQVSYMCRSVNKGKLEKAKACEKAKAVKP